MDKRALRKVRNRIAKLKPEQFDMSAPPFLFDDCGCIAAWGNKILGEDGWEEATRGLTRVTGGRTAYGDLIMPPDWTIKGKYTIPQAVRVLDHLLETGKVDWSVAGEP